MTEPFYSLLLIVGAFGFGFGVGVRWEGTQADKVIDRLMCELKKAHATILLMRETR